MLFCFQLTLITVLSCHVITIFLSTGIGNPRGNENPFLLSMGIFWFRVHQYWAIRLRDYYRTDPSVDPTIRRLAEEDDEFIFNRARQFTIATHQVQCGHYRVATW